MHPRLLAFLVVVVTVAGCGSSAAPQPTPVRTALVATIHPPPKVIKANHHYTATVVTSDGTFTIELLPKIAPIAVNNFVYLSRRHFYDNMLIFRIIKDFMFQTGDPTNNDGTGSPGYKIADEKITLPYTFGTVAMANAGTPNSGASQFFVVVARTYTFKHPTYTIFGKVVSGSDVLVRIANSPVQINPATGELSEPVNDVTVSRITVRG